MVLHGARARWVKKITTELCGREFSRQTVQPDRKTRYASPCLGRSAYLFLLTDAIGLKIRREEAVRSAMALHARGISEDGYREILGFKIALRETGESWRELLGELKNEASPA